MKLLLLIRHAKSDWNFDVEDFDRPLNVRGQRDAPVMAQRLIKKDIKIDCFVSSPANRAITTATFFAEAYAKELKNIITIPSLYQPTTSALGDVLETFNDDFSTVALFSHNPSITEFANQLTSVKIDDMPACAVFAVKSDVAAWKAFMQGKKEFFFFDYPNLD